MLEQENVNSVLLRHTMKLKPEKQKKNVNVLSAKQPLDGRNGLENGFLWDTSVNVYS